jgi:ketohexokinase
LINIFDSRGFKVQFQPKKTILGLGISTLDILIPCPTFPLEDTETRVAKPNHQLGGNITNSFKLLAQTHHSLYLAGHLAIDAHGSFIRQSLEALGIHTELMLNQAGSTPTSYVIQNQATASRTILHHRDLPEYQLHESLLNLQPNPDWIHMEARNVEEQLRIIPRLRASYPNARLSLEVEKPREHWQSLLPLVDEVYFSRALIQGHLGLEAETALNQLQISAPNACLFLAWGETGAYAQDQTGKIYFSPALKLPKVVDTLGAGDSFNAGLILSGLEGKNTQERLHFANQLAGRKCAQVGFDKLL